MAHIFYHLDAGRQAAVFARNTADNLLAEFFLSNRSSGQKGAFLSIQISSIIDFLKQFLKMIFDHLQHTYLTDICYRSLEIFEK